MIGSAFLVSQIPGTPISTSVSSSTSDLPSSVLQDTSGIDPVDQPHSRVLPPGDVLATSFILASLSSCPSVNDSNSSSSFLCNDDSGTACFHDQYLVNKSDHILWSHGSVRWNELVSGWMKYMNWQSWESEFRESLPVDVHLLNTKARSQVHTIGHKTYKLDDTANRSGANSQEVTENVEALEDSQDWITEILNWLDQTVLERSSQTKFFQLGMAVSNY